ncbi:MAG: hypothetical protein KBG28_17530 [Kofleriaceae bacterium]|jgi:hypothetical protein|nr:hypothetical protein [Kofleriaceae bacterium]
MPFQPADPLSLAVFMLLAGGVALGIAVVLRRAARAGVAPHLGLALAGYLLGFAALVALAPEAWRPLPLLPVLMLSVGAVAVAVAFGPLGGHLAATAPLGLLVGVQGVRLPLELVLHRWAEVGTVPPTMTWTGANLDIIAGVVALLAAPLAGRARLVAWIAQLVGVVLLLNVVRVVVMSSPLPFAWPLERPLRLAEHLPYALIAPMFVGPAIAVHLITFRRLLAPVRGGPPSAAGTGVV